MVVGWGLIGPLQGRVGGRPQLSVWTPTSRANIFQKGSSALLYPCVTAVISHEKNIFLHENLLKEPIEFHKGNILGVLLRRMEIARFLPYFISKNSTFSTFRTTLGSPTNSTESTAGVSDNKIPLLSLSICKSIH